MSVFPAKKLSLFAEKTKYEHQKGDFMKRLFLLSIIISLVLSLTACGINDCDDVADYFDEDLYVVRELEEEKIKDYLERQPEEFQNYSDSIEEMFNVYKKTNTAAFEDWAYIVEFSDEETAGNCEKYLTESNKSITVKRFGDILVYGNSLVIYNIAG